MVLLGFKKADDDRPSLEKLTLSAIVSPFTLVRTLQVLHYWLSKKSSFPFLPDFSNQSLTHCHSLQFVAKAHLQLSASSVQFLSRNQIALSCAGPMVA